MAKFTFEVEVTGVVEGKELGLRIEALLNQHKLAEAESTLGAGRLIRCEGVRWIEDCECYRCTQEVDD